MDKLFGSFRGWLNKSTFFKKKDGGVLIVFVFTLMPILALTAFAYDLSLYTYVRAQLEYAADAAALTAARFDPSLSTTISQDVFYANFQQGYLGVFATPNISASSDKKTFTVTVSSSMPTVMAKMLTIQSLPIHVLSQTQVDFTTLEVAMVLDVTGSMSSNNKIGNLRAAANQFVTTIFGTETVSSYANVSIVPFVATVNVGSDKTSWLSDPITARTTASGGSFPTGEPWKGCVGVRNSPYEETDDPPSVAKWPTYFAASTYVNSSSNNDNDWTVTGAGAVQIKTALSGVTVGPNRSCGPAIQPLTNVSSKLTTLINSLQPVNGGGTFANLGLIWGLRTLSPSWAGLWTGGANPVAYGSANTRKVLVIETDGVSQWFNDSHAPSGGDPSAYGFGSTQATRIGLGRLSGVTTPSKATAAINALVAKNCTTIKNKGIEIYTVTFLVTDPAVQTLYQSCASKPSNYYNITSSPDIVTAFNDIATKIKTIRIVQ